MLTRVLCVDSDPSLSGILEKSLREQGYDVEARHDGDAALEALSDEPFDLALLDIQLPRRDGFELLEEIRALPSPACDIPVFLLTGTRITPAYKSRAKSAGATAMFTKPIPLKKLHELVRKHIKEGPPRADSVGASPPAVAARCSTTSPNEIDSVLALEGELRDLDFPSLLHHLHGLRATGALLFTNARKRKVVQVREGYPVSVKSNLIGECFGNQLVQQGKISQEVFEELIVRTSPFAALCMAC
jgi:two-component system chemotaxis response regulator CheY